MAAVFPRNKAVTPPSLCMIFCHDIHMDSDGYTTVVACNCLRMRIRSNGAVAMRDPAPATPPATRLCHGLVSVVGVEDSGEEDSDVAEADKASLETPVFSSQRVLTAVCCIIPIMAMVSEREAKQKKREEVKKRQRFVMARWIRWWWLRANNKNGENGSEL
eukprot:scaffold1143_cov177-Amphora_coffeaeformis.AAC.4